MNETLSTMRSEPETRENLENRSGCNTLKIRIGKPYGITKIGARTMSIIAVGGHEVTRNLSEPSDQKLMHIDVYAELLKSNKPANSFLSTKSITHERWWQKNSHRQQIHGILWSTWGHVEQDLAGQISVGREELKLISNWGRTKIEINRHCAILEEDAMRLATEAGVSAHVLDISEKKTQLRGLLNTGTWV